MRNIKSGSVKMMAVMLVFIVILSFLPSDTAKAAVITKNNVEEMPIQLLGYEANTVTFDREIISIRAYSGSEYVTYKKVSYNKLCFIGRKCWRSQDHKVLRESEHKSVHWEGVSQGCNHFQGYKECECIR